MNTETLVEYMMYLDSQECGPSVPAASKQAVAWISARLVREPPRLDDQLILTLQEKIFEERGKELREAEPVPMELVAQVEEEVIATTCHSRSLFLGIWLCMVYASLRFNDVIHILSDKLKYGANVLTGAIWQTSRKEEQRLPICSRRGAFRPETLAVYLVGEARVRVDGV